MCGTWARERAEQPTGKASHTTPWAPDEPQAGRCSPAKSHLFHSCPSRASGRKAGAYLGSGGREDVAPAAFLPGDTHCPSTESAPSTSWTQHSSSALALRRLKATCKQRPGGGRAAHLGPGWRPG